jgi:hypothetical protein
MDEVEIWEYVGERKVYLGRRDEWYFDDYRPNMTAREVIEMLAKALKKFVDDAKELECEELADDELFGVLEMWFDHDSSSKGYFDSIANLEDENGEPIDGDEFDQVLNLYKSRLSSS